MSELPETISEKDALRVTITLFKELQAERDQLLENTSSKLIVDLVKQNKIMRETLLELRHNCKRYAESGKEKMDIIKIQTVVDCALAKCGSSK